MKPVSTVTEAGDLEASEVPRYASAEESKEAGEVSGAAAYGLSQLVQDMTREDNGNRVKLESVRAFCVLFAQKLKSGTVR